MQFCEDVILGLDIGIGSVGWALVKKYTSSDPGADIPEAECTTIIGMGSRIFKVPEDPKTKKLNNQKRRSARMQRRVIHRRASRMRQIRELLKKHGFSNATDISLLHQSQIQADPWFLRKKALDTLLSPDEFATVLIHIAKHRGFRSNSKKDKTDAETGKILKPMIALRAEVQNSSWRTVGEFIAQQPAKRNHPGIDGKPAYEHTILRPLLEEEVDILFQKQHECGNPLASDSIRAEYTIAAFLQRPLKSIADLIGKCAFIEDEKRAPKFAWTSERFRLATRAATLRLNNVSVMGKVAQREFDSDEIEQILRLVGPHKSITYTLLRKTLNLPDNWHFDGLSYGHKNKKGKEENPENTDIVMRTGACCTGSYAFYKTLEASSFSRLAALRTTHGSLCLDYLASLISENDDLAFIEKEIATLPLETTERTSLLNGLKNGAFAGFKGVMHLSLLAMETITPHLVTARDYAKACELAGFDHTKTQTVNMADVRNPVVRRVLREVRQQIHAIVTEYKIIPGKVHIELLRDVGKSADERNKMDRGIRNRTSKKLANKERLASLLGINPIDVSRDSLLRYELWLQQGELCAYYMLWRNTGGSRYYSAATAFPDGKIPIQLLRDQSGQLEVDHITPRSRTQDNSFHNLCLCLPAANQTKKNQTPYEWLGQHNPQAWHDFEEWIQTRPYSGFKKRNLLIKDLSEEKQNIFCSRNLNDSRYAARLSMQVVQDLYNKWSTQVGIPQYHPDGKEIRRIFARPGGITAFLRRQWGLESLKYDSSKKRIGDRHHALDAFVVACCSERLLQLSTAIFQQQEHKYKSIDLPAPMPDCRNTVIKALNEVFVSRAERGRTKGPLHEETLRSIQQEPDADGNMVPMLYKRVSVTSLTEKSLDKIKDAERCPDIIKALEKWLGAGKPKETDRLPCSAKGDIIRRVRLCEGSYKSGVFLQRGEGIAQADNGSMVRTDVYTHEGRYYLVPVYTWNIARGVVPSKAIKGGKPEEDWLAMDEQYTFLFSLTPDCYVITEDNKNFIREGYFMGTNRSTASITLAMAHDHSEQINGIGVQTLKVFSKYRVDRMGRLHKVTKEKKP